MLREEQLVPSTDRGPVQFRVRRRLMSIDDEYWVEDDWIEDAAGQRMYRVDGADLRRRRTLVLEDPDGRRSVLIRERHRPAGDALAIEDAAERRIATVTRARVGWLRRRWVVRVEDGPDLEIVGDVQDHEYTFGGGSTPVVVVSRTEVAVPETYGVQVPREQDPLLVLAAVVAVDGLFTRRRDRPTRAAPRPGARRPRRSG